MGEIGKCDGAALNRRWRDEGDNTVAKVSIFARRHNRRIIQRQRLAMVTEFARIAVTESALALVWERHACVSFMFAMADEAVFRVNGHRLARDRTQSEVCDLWQMECKCDVATKARLVHRLGRRRLRARGSIVPAFRFEDRADNRRYGAAIVRAGKPRL